MGFETVSCLLVLVSHCSTAFGRVFCRDLSGICLVNMCAQSGSTARLFFSLFFEIDMIINLTRLNTVIVGSLSGSRLKSARFLVGESSVPMASSVSIQIIKINH